MAYVDDPNKNEQEAQVAGAAPLSNVAPTQSQAPTESAPMGSQAPQIQSGASVDQATSQGGVVNKKAPKASSGTYTNIQRYVEKNQPQAQKISSAVTQDVGRQADQVRQAVEQQKQQQQNVLSANQQAIQAGQDWANQQVQNIMTQPAQAEGATVYTPSQDDISRFQNLMSGNVAGVQQVQDLDLGQQQSRIRALQNLAGQAGTEQGRRNLLGQTFQKQGEYTRGMSGLDELITSGDQAAREGLVTGVQGQAQQLGQDVQSAQQQARQALGLQQQALSDIGANVTQAGTEAVTGIDQSISSRLENEQAAREGLFGQAQQIDQANQDRLNKLNEFYNTVAGLDSQSKGGFASVLMRNNISDAELKNWLDYRGISTDDYTTANDYLNSVRLNQADLERIGVEPLDVHNYFYQDPTIGGFDPTGAWRTHSLGMFGQISDALRGYNAAPTASAMGEQGFDTSTIGQGTDLTRANVATQEEIDQFNALKSLLGQQDIITPESKQDYLSSEELQQIIDRYRL